MNDGVIAKHIFKLKSILIFYENEYYVNYMFGMFIISQHTHTQLFLAIYLNMKEYS